MKIIAMNASPRGSGSMTRKLVEAVLAGAREKGAEVEFVDLCELDIGYCTACGTCYATGDCPLSDDADALIDRMRDADAIVLGSPNYINSVTAQLKTLFDRMGDCVHCQVLSGKYGAAVCTAGGSRADEVVTYMNETLFLMGATIVGGVGEIMADGPDSFEHAVAEAHRLGGMLADAVRSGMTDPDQEATRAPLREHFRNLVTFRKDEWAHDYEYWSAMGWL
ncbi:MAG: flavodoxin family protein [Methanomicrobiales archaeon]|nr:flavodoxin family protein [Methanomicrobiales archaeon]